MGDGAEATSSCGRGAPPLSEGSRRHSTSKPPLALSRLPPPLNTCSTNPCRPRHLPAELAKVIDRVGIPKRLGNPRGRAFPQLLFAVFNQQVSVAAADSIARRFLDTCVRLRAYRASNGEGGSPDPIASELEAQLGDSVRSDPTVPPRTSHPDWPEPEFVLSMSPETLRSVGLSGRKVEYAHATAQACLPDGALSEAAIQEMSADELRAAIVAVRGLGPWTADLFLMFYAGHADVIPVGDLGVRRSYGLLRGAGTVPSPAAVTKGTEHWSPHRTVGSLLLWDLGWEIAAAAKAQPKASKRPRRSSKKGGGADLAPGEPSAIEDGMVVAKEAAAAAKPATASSKPRGRPRKRPTADTGSPSDGKMASALAAELAVAASPLPLESATAIVPETPQPPSASRRSPRLHKKTST